MSTDPQQSDLFIPISYESKNKLIRTWGNEIVLRCFCGDSPSHSMWGQYATPVCPKCLEKCEVIPHEWGILL